MMSGIFIVPIADVIQLESDRGPARGRRYSDRKDRAVALAYYNYYLAFIV